MITTVRARSWRWAKSVRSAANAAMSSWSVRVSPGGGRRGGSRCRRRRVRRVRPREPVREDAAVGQRLGPLGQRAVEGVVAAEDQVGQGGQSAVGEGVRLGDHAGRRVQTRGDGGAAAVAVVATEPRAPTNQTPVRPADSARCAAPARPMTSARSAEPAGRKPRRARRVDAAWGVGSAFTIGVCGHGLPPWGMGRGEGRRAGEGACFPRPSSAERRLPYFGGSSFSWMLRKDTWSSAPWFWRPM